MIKKECFLFFIEFIFKIHYEENIFQLKFFANLFGSYIEAIVYVLKYHIENQLTFFTLENFNFNQIFHYQETSYLISNDILSFIRRAYIFHIDSEVINEKIYPLSTDKLVLLDDEFVKILNCLI